jgi:hypothetical protein
MPRRPDASAPDLDTLLLPAWVGLLIRVGPIAFPAHEVPDDRVGFDLALIALIDVGLADAEVVAVVSDPAHAISRLPRKHGAAWTRRTITQTRRSLERPHPTLTAEALLRLTDQSALGAGLGRSAA